MCVELKYPVDISNIDTGGHNIIANKQSSGFQASDFIQDFEAGRFQFPVNARNINRRQKTEKLKTYNTNLK